jgi:hypothetical protein
MKILHWADKYRTMQVKASIKDSHLFMENIKYSMEHGADGFGTISTDHLLHYSEDRLLLFRHVR